MLFWIKNSFAIRASSKGSIEKHYEILSKEFGDVHQKRILEIATGSGNAVNFLSNDNHYTGLDISIGLLKRAMKNLVKAGFKDAKCYIADAIELPFRDKVFDVAICNLSLNFFKDTELFIVELKRVLKEGGVFYCSVPLPEKKSLNVRIRGILYTREELKQLFEKQQFIFESLPYENGVLLYLKAVLPKT